MIEEKRNLNVLFVSRGKSLNSISVIIKEQGESLVRNRINVSYFPIKGKGIRGYLLSLILLNKIIKENKIDIMHAHYGLSGLVAVLQRKVPVIVTFHGSDIWIRWVRKISLIASYLSEWNIFISKNLQDHAKGFRRSRSSIIPCGVDFEKFFPIDKIYARKLLGMSKNDIYILFSSSFMKKIKNYPLAKKALEYIPKAKLIELKGYKKEEVNYLMNACDVLLVTSFNESGPLVIKEAMACNLPIVSTNVGDVKEVIGKTEGCYLVNYYPKCIAEKIKMALNFGTRTNGREKIKNYEKNIIAERIKDVYFKVQNKKNEDS